MTTMLQVRGRVSDLNGIGVGIHHLGTYARTRAQPHTHDVVEINYIVRGAGRHLLGPTSHATGAGSLGIVHYTQSHDILTSRGGMEIINLYLDIANHPLPAVGPDLQRHLNRILPLHPSLRHRQNQFVHLRFPPGGAQEAPLRAMLDEQRRREPGWREAMLAHFRLFLVICARHAAQAGAYGDADPGRSDLAMAAVIGRLDADPALAHELGDLARHAGMTRSSLCRAFRRYTGATISGYLARNRTNAAMLALRASRDPITDIAARCGFADQSYFNRTFRRFTGMSPSAWRREGT